ncbi:MAG: hypothetical protein OXQ92_00635 [Boseongicola sp.]|nr:hypothetical protein [Boseongicola sp.]MDD9979212.1 hypothetical protein [Boseongicola sp.]
MMKKFVFLSVCGAALAACGGGGGGVSHSTPFSEVSATTADLVAKTNRNPGGAAEFYEVLATLPAIDSASYEGVIGITQAVTTPPPTGYVSPITMTADFTAPDAQISGTANEFYIAQDVTTLPVAPAQAISGSVDVSADLNACCGSLSVSFDGNVDFNNDGTASEALSGDGSGLFIGPNSTTAEFFLATGDDIPVTGSSIFTGVDIRLIAEQQ